MLTFKFEGTRYYISVRSAVIIRFIQLKLKGIRLLRSRKFFGVESLVLFLMMTTIWVMCGFAIYAIENMGKLTLFETMWDLKKEYIATVIIVIAMRWCTNVIENKKRLKMQHRAYYDLLTSADRLFEPYIGEYNQNYMAFYNDEMLYGTINFINARSNIFKMNDKDFYDCIESITLELDNISSQYYGGNIVVHDEESFVICLKDTVMAVKTITPTKIIETKGNALVEMALEIFLLIEQLRMTWREDVVDRKRIISLLYENNSTQIAESFYLRMHVLSVEEIINQVFEKGY